MAQPTEPASPKRRREAREKGQVARSDELASGLQLLVGAAVLSSLGPPAFGRLAELTARTLIAAPSRRGPSASLVLGAGLETGLLSVLPGLAILAAVGGLVAFAQVGPVVSGKALLPTLERLDPVAGLRRMFSTRSLYGLAKNLVKIALVGWILWGVLQGLLPEIAGLVAGSPARIGRALGTATIRLLVRGGVALTAIGLLDLAYQRWKLGQELRMTKEEVQREHREQEGDPRHKQERARLHRDILTHSRIEDVRRADVVIVNPDHIAVALQYDEEGMDAPRVLAKGEHVIAKQIIDVARAHGIPVVRDVALARALRDLEIDEEIPEDLYEAVAEILRLAWAERGEAEGGGPGEPGAR
jgi:flagellar biosynthesis protein FlhB